MLVSYLDSFNMTSHQEEGGAGERFQGQDTLYLAHGELNFVKQNGSNMYFTLKTLGMIPFHLYKNSAQEFLGKLNECIRVGQKLVDSAKKPADGTYHEIVISENLDPKLELRFRLNLVVSVYNGKPYLHLRNFVFIKDQQIWHHTKRGVRLAIDQKEADAMKAKKKKKITIAAKYNAPTISAVPEESPL